MSTRRVQVEPLPSWLDVARLLGPATFRVGELESGWLRAQAELTVTEAADLAARLRGLGFAGRAVAVTIEPPLPRAATRSARTLDARRRRAASTGFSRRDARLDDEGRTSLTPEALALELGERAGAGTVVDACCGAGGSAIGFARAGSRVVAIDRDPARLALAGHNARVYGVADRIEFRLDDALTLVPKLAADLLFIDPPWGLSYDRTCVLSADLPLLEPLIAAAASHSYPRIWAKLPPSFDPASLPAAPPSVQSVQAVFGVGQGDQRRVKFLLVELNDAAQGSISAG